MHRINAVERARFLEMIDQYASEAVFEHEEDCSKKRCPGCLKERLASAIERYMLEIDAIADGAN